jgi:hypothetical protein
VVGSCATGIFLPATRRKAAGTHETASRDLDSDRHGPAAAIRNNGGNRNGVFPYQRQKPSPSIGASWRVQDGGIAGHAR